MNYDQLIRQVGITSDAARDFRDAAATLAQNANGTRSHCSGVVVFSWTMKLRLWSACLVATAVLVSGCGSGSEPSPSPAISATSAPSVSVSSVLPSSPSIPRSPTPSVSDTKLSDEEAIVEDLLREPGTFGDAAFILDSAVAAIKEKNPDSAEALAAAVVDVTHGDYAEATQGLLDFSPEIDDDPARPVEKLGEVEVVGQNHFAVVLDASGSMAEPSGGITRMQEAKAAVEAFASQLPDSSTLSLRVYGHKGSNAGADKAESCAATEVVYEGSPTGVGGAMQKFEPTGWTPLGAAILAARQDIPDGASDAIVYVVTDGIETCGGDPVEAARQLAAEGVKPVVNVIGFQVGDADQAELRRIAEAGGGDFIDAHSGADLKNYWQEDRNRMMAAWNEWQDQALARIREQGSANMKAADDFGDSLMDGITQEWNNQAAALDVLEKEGFLDHEASRAAWSSLYDRQRGIWSWGYDESTSAWMDSYDVQTSRWQDAYQLGSGKWTEHYRKEP